MNKRLIGLAVLLASFSSGIVLADDSTSIDATGKMTKPSTSDDSTDKAASPMGDANGAAGGAGAASKNTGPAEMDLSAPTAPTGKGGSSSSPSGS